MGFIVCVWGGGRRATWQGVRHGTWACTVCCIRSWRCQIGRQCLDASSTYCCAEVRFCCVAVRQPALMRLGKAATGHRLVAAASAAASSCCLPLTSSMYALNHLPASPLNIHGWLPCSNTAETRFSATLSCICIHSCYGIQLNIQLASRTIQQNHCSQRCQL